MPPSNSFTGRYTDSQNNSGQLAIYNNYNNSNTPDRGPKMWPSLGLDEWDLNDDTAFWAPSLSSFSLSLPAQSPTTNSIANLWPQNNTQHTWQPTVDPKMAQQLTDRKSVV